MKWRLVLQGLRLGYFLYRWPKLFIVTELSKEGVVIRSIAITSASSDYVLCVASFGTGATYRVRARCELILVHLTLRLGVSGIDLTRATVELLLSLLGLL